MIGNSDMKRPVSNSIHWQIDAAAVNVAGIKSMQLKQICMWVIVSLAARAIIKDLLVTKKLSGVFLYRTGMILDFLCVGKF